MPLEWLTDDPDTAQIGLLTEALTLGLGRARGLRHVLRARRHLVRVGDEIETRFSRVAARGRRNPGGHRTRDRRGWAEAIEVHVEAPAGGGC